MSSRATLLPRDIHLKVNEGENVVEIPSTPWVVEALTTTRETGIFSPKVRAARRERVYIQAMWPGPPCERTSR
jgi:hypothetical protein